MLATTFFRGAEHLREAQRPLRVLVLEARRDVDQRGELRVDVAQHVAYARDAAERRGAVLRERRDHRAVARLRRVIPVRVRGERDAERRRRDLRREQQKE